MALAAAVCVVRSISPATAAPDTVDAWLDKIKALAAADPGPDIGPQEVAEVFHLRPRHPDRCHNDLDLAPDHPVFVVSAWASLIGPLSCEPLKLGTVTFVVSAGPAFLPHAIKSFTSFFADEPAIRREGPNTDYRWQIGADRVVVVTKYGAKSDAGATGVTFVKLQPI